MDIRGKFALVTGAAKRLGRQIAFELASAGAQVALHYCNSAAAARQTANTIIENGGHAKLFQADLANPDRLTDMFIRIKQEFGGLDILVNNASIYTKTPIDTLTSDQWDRLNALNSRAPALCIRHAIEMMPNGGAIVNIADSSSDSPWPGYPAYCASKAAMVALTRSCAKSLATRGIRVNAVSPGVILWSDDIPQEARQQVLTQIPMKRTGCPQDIASAVTFLCENNYITGQVLRVDGGWTIK